MNSVPRATRSIPCHAQQAMNKVDGDGFTPYKADAWCCHYEGVMIFDAGEYPKVGALWRTYLFDDGSSMNIHKLGCSIFYTEQEARRWKHWPDHSPQRLY